MDIGEQDPPFRMIKMVTVRELARPEGVGRAPPTIVIEGVDELVEALQAA
jgi:hypothetical protein